MSNTRKAKGRPGPFRKVGPLNPSPDEMNRILAQKPGLYIVEHLHDPGCLAQVSQNSDDCCCSPDKQLLRFAPRKEARP